MTRDERNRVVEFLALIGENPYAIHQHALERAKRSRYYREKLTNGEGS